MTGEPEKQYIRCVSNPLDKNIPNKFSNRVQLIRGYCIIND